MGGLCWSLIFSENRLIPAHQRRKDPPHLRLRLTDAGFQRGEIDVLVSTTVIEVGVDVPNASVMVVEHAERFGLAQLHQLRGRVGRGAAKSYCILVTGGKVSPTAEERLEAMVRTQDGFELAELDLAMRGPGEVFGTRQAGLPDFRIANLVRDRKLLELARQEAAQFIATPPENLFWKFRQVRSKKTKILKSGLNANLKKKSALKLKKSNY